MTNNVTATPNAGERASQTIQDAIDAIEAQIVLIKGSSEPASLREFGKLCTEKANLITRRDRALKREAAEEKKAAQAAELEGLDVEELREATKMDIRKWLKANDYYYTHRDNSYWLYTPGDREPWTPHSRMSMVDHDPRLSPRSPYFALFTEVLQEDGRWFRDHTRTFAKVGPQTLNMLRWDFLKPQEGQHHWVFDTLMMSLGGGKAENIAHLEKVLLAKLHNPGNYTLPTVVISDDGGTGKSLFAEKLLPTLFGQDLVAPNVSMEEITGQFNSHLQGKAVWFVNENRADRNDHEAIKRVLGSATLRAERKGKDAKLTDNTALMLVAGNFSLGAIKLSGTEVDRRFSILKSTGITLKSLTSKKLGITEAEADQWMKAKGQHIISDPAEAAKWLNHLIAKHGKVTDVLALHGQDYQDMLDAQMDVTQQVYQLFLTHPCWTTPDEGMIKRKTMFDYYVDYCRRHNIRSMTNQRFYAEAEKWMKRKGIDFMKKTVKWGGSTAEVYLNPNCTQKHPTDHHFVELGEWKVSID